MKFGSCPTIHYDCPMAYPLPIRIVHFLLSKLRFPALTVGFGLFTLLYLVFYVPGSMFGPEQYLILDSDLERKGFYITTAAVPAYLMMCFVAGVRLMATNYSFLFMQLNSTALDQFSVDKNRRGKFWPLAVLSGFILSYLNVYVPGLIFDPGSDGFLESVAVVVGNILIWTTIVLVMFFFYLESHAFHQLGKRIPIGLYDLDKLNGFGHASLSGFLIVMGGLALSTIQSIDQEFSWARYGQPLFIAIPSAIALAMLPSWSVHRRLRKEKRAHLIELNEQISNASNALSPQALERMNSLLSRKAMVAGFRTWPMDFSIVSRFVLYVFIPPLAWIGAALMELYLDSYLTG